METNGTTRIEMETMESIISLSHNVEKLVTHLCEPEKKKIDYDAADIMKNRLSSLDKDLDYFIHNTLENCEMYEIRQRFLEFQHDIENIAQIPVLRKAEAAL